MCRALNWRIGSNNCYVRIFVKPLCEFANFFLLQGASLSKESCANSSRHWPLCFTWIGYLRLMVRRELCYLGSTEKIFRKIFFSRPYVNTYIERDVHSLAQIGDTLTFMQFMVALAGRTGELLNMESLAKDIGVSAPTIKRWLSILQASNVIYLLQSFSLNTTKRVVKTPKVYFTDTGLVCYLCRWHTTETLINGAQAGNIFETFVVSEIIKICLSTKSRIYFASKA